MKKIHNIKQLRAAKKRLAQRRGELEQLIQYDWLRIKESMQPQELGEAMLGSVMKSSSEKKGVDFFADSLSQLAAGITRKAILKVTEKLRNRSTKN